MPKDDDDKKDDLFAYTRSRATDPDTSVEAAESISPRLRELQKRVLAFAARTPDGFTDRDLEAAMGDSGSTWRTRRSELTERGLIRDSGERRTYPPKGRRHIIWQITITGLQDAGKEVF
jgi:hypothetical protein